MKSLGGLLGCLATFLVIAVFTLPLLFGLFWSGAHCEPVPHCQRESEAFVGGAFAALLGLAALAGFAIRFVINRLAAQRDDQGTSTGFVLGAAVAVMLATCGVIAAVYLVLVVIPAPRG